MTGSRKRAFFLGAALVVAAACDLNNSHVKSGELYRTGEAPYDAFFHDVHEIQIAAADFDDDKRAARKPITDALDLTPTAADDTIVSATREQLTAALPQIGGARLVVEGDDAHVRTQTGSRGSAGSERLILAIEATTKAEIARGKKLKDVQPKVETVLKTGHELEPHVKEDFAKVGGNKPFEVRQELTSSYDVLSVINYKARREVRATESFVTDLQRAVEVGPPGDPSGWPAMSAPSSSAPAASGSSSSDAGAPAPPPPRYSPPPHAVPPHPAAQHAPPPPHDAPEPKPAPAPKPANTGEVFNP